MFLQLIYWTCTNWSWHKFYYSRLDPLFLAMAGFVSMATIVSFSILFLPKFGDSRAQQKSALKREAEEDEDEMFSLSQVVGQAIQGKDCADRLACELGRAIRSMQLGQKPLRYVVPTYLFSILSPIDSGELLFNPFFYLCNFSSVCGKQTEKIKGIEHNTL